MNLPLTIKNNLKELLIGTAFETVARSIVDLIKPPRQDILTSRQDDTYVYQIMKRILDKSSNCIDVGGNMGSVLTQICQLAPLGEHYAFEPLPRLATRLQKRFPKVDVRQIALSDLEGETTFWHVVDAPALSGLKQRDYSYWGYNNAQTESIAIKTQKLDDILQPDFKVNFIKVDVEGAEFQVFKGAIRTLKTHKPYLVFEFGHSGMVDYKTTPGMMYDLLVNQCGLNIFKLNSWLEGLAPLSETEFTIICEEDSAWNFLATP
ncbi:MAG: FkbM family methyltransferase [Moorea sp. SIO3C2]|nr:FkbM family methyltransferase [Moorena sp. SIO3C2]